MKASVRRYALVSHLALQSAKGPPFARRSSGFRSPVAAESANFLLHLTHWVHPRHNVPNLMYHMLFSIGKCFFILARIRNCCKFNEGHSALQLLLNNEEKQSVARILGTAACSLAISLGIRHACSD